MDKKLILITVILILLFSGLQNVSASPKLQSDIEFLSSISTPFNTTQTECTYSPIERIVCQYESGKLRILTFFYNNAESSIVVEWKGVRVAVVERGVLYKFSNGGGWQGYIHKVANQERK